MDFVGEADFGHVVTAAGGGVGVVAVSGILVITGVLGASGVLVITGVLAGGGIRVGVVASRWFPGLARMQGVVAWPNRLVVRVELQGEVLVPHRREVRKVHPHGGVLSVR